MRNELEPTLPQAVVALTPTRLRGKDASVREHGRRALVDGHDTCHGERSAARTLPATQCLAVCLKCAASASMTRAGASLSVRPVAVTLYSTASATHSPRSFLYTSTSKRIGGSLARCIIGQPWSGGP